MFYFNFTCKQLYLCKLINYFPNLKQFTLFNILIYNSTNKPKSKRKYPNLKGKCLLIIDDLPSLHTKLPLDNKLSQINDMCL